MAVSPEVLEQWRGVGGNERAVKMQQNEQGSVSSKQSVVPLTFGRNHTASKALASSPLFIDRHQCSWTPQPMLFVPLQLPQPSSTWEEGEHKLPAALSKEKPSWKVDGKIATSPFMFQLQSIIISEALSCAKCWYLGGALRRVGCVGAGMWR